MLSVASHPKRLFEETEARPGFSEASSPSGFPTNKRVRLLNSSPSARGCTHLAGESSAYQSFALSVSGLLSLFPEMEEQAVISVLSDCGDNIDAAIKRLSELRLTQNNSRQAEEAATAAAEARARESQQSQTPPSTSGSAPGFQTAEWVELLVQEMAASKDVGDARARASRLLTMFNKHLADQGSHAAVEKLQEVQKENHILKRAVQIQNTKLQERAHQDQEIQQLRLMLGQYQEQVRTLELNIYSLAVHLQKATSETSITGGHHPPDVC